MRGPRYRKIGQTANEEITLLEWMMGDKLLSAFANNRSLKWSLPAYIIWKIVHQLNNVMVPTSDIDIHLNCVRIKIDLESNLLNKHGYFCK